MATWAIVNAIGLVVVLLANRALGSRIGAVSRAYDTPFTPANPAFSIWSVIYTLLGVTAVAQFYDASIATDLGGWYIAQCIMTVAWLIAFTRRRIKTAAVALVATTALVGVCYARAQRWRAIAHHTWPRVSTTVALSIFWGWTIVASVIALATTAPKPIIERLRGVVWITVWAAVLAVQIRVIDPLLSLPFAWAAAWRATRGDTTAAVASVGFALSYIGVQTASCLS